MPLKVDPVVLPLRVPDVEDVADPDMVEVALKMNNRAIWLCDGC